MYKRLFTEKIKDSGYKYHSTQIDLYDSASEKDYNFFQIQNKIPDDIVNNGTFENPLGKENDPHVTVLYGIEKEDAYFTIRKLLKGFGPVEIQLGDIDKFSNDEKGYDVLQVKIHSPKLVSINSAIKEAVEHKSTFPDYKPHLTLAYVYPNSGDFLLGPCEWTGVKYTFNVIKFSHTDKYKMAIPLL